MQNTVQDMAVPSQQVLAGSVPLENQTVDSEVMFLNIRPENNPSQLVQTPVPMNSQATASSAPRAAPDQTASQSKIKLESFHIPVPSVGGSRAMLKAPPASASPVPMAASLASSSADADASIAADTTALLDEDDENLLEKTSESKEQTFDTVDVHSNRLDFPQKNGERINESANLTRPKAADHTDYGTSAFEVDWVPAGGHFVLGLENRVYFRANRDFKGDLIDQTGKTVATIETGSDHFGEFRWTPKSGNAYQLRLSGEEFSGQQISLDLKYESLPVAFDIEQAVLTSGEPIVVSLNARQDDFPVIATVLKQGVPILAQTRVLEQGPNSFEIPLPPETHGLLDILILAGASDTQQQLLARQSVFRRPDRFLNVNAKSKVTPLANGNASWNFDVQVLNESGKPAAFTMVGVNVIQDRTHSELSRKILAKQPTLTDQLFFPMLNVENWEQFETTLDTPENGSATQLKYHLAKDRNDSVNFDENAMEAIRPLVYDNFQETQSQYQEKVSHFQNARNSWMRIFMIISVFGGMGFAVLVMILVIMRLASAVRMFVLTAIVGLSCVFLCLAMLKTQVTFSESFRKTPFVSHNMKETEFRPPSQENEQTVASLSQFDQAQKLPLLKHPDNLLHDRRNLPDPSAPVSFENVLWQPELKTDAQGRVGFDFLVTDAEDSAIQIMVDAFDESGRIGSYRIYWVDSKN